MSKETYTIDASGKIVGRLAAEVARILQGKHRPDYTPHLDIDEDVIVINTSELEISGRKADQKKYYRHSGYLGGIKNIVYKKLFAKDPNEVLRKAVYGMLPSNKLRSKRINRLKLYPKAITKILSL